MHQRHFATLLVGTAGILLSATSALAETAHTDIQRLLVRDGNNAGRIDRRDNGTDRPERQVGTGAEHAAMTQLASGEILITAIGSYEDVAPFDGPVPDRLQLLCASITLDPLTGPKMSVLRYVTNNDGDRYRNGMHPAMQTIDGGKAVAVFYNYAPNDHAYRYVKVLGPGCTELSEQTRVLAKNNDNCSENQAVKPALVSDENGKSRLIEFAGCNGNGRDDAWILGVSIEKNPGGTGTGSYSVEKEYDFSIEPNEERTRGSCEIPVDQEDFAYCCWTAGNTQPPNRGVRCGGVDTREGTDDDDRLLWREYVARRDNDQYRTMIRMAPVLNSAGQVTSSAYIAFQDGERSGNNRKGTYIQMAGLIKATRDGLEISSIPQEFATDLEVTHGSICSTLWGEESNAVSRAFMVHGSHNGSARAADAVVASVDGLGSPLKENTRMQLGASIDSSWLSNIYGENPQNQGRNFTQCVGDIRNPGFGVAGGYMPEVKTFVGIPATGRRVDPNPDAMYTTEDKLALEVVLVPAVFTDTGGDAQPAPGADPADPAEPIPTPGEPAPGVGENGVSACNVSGGGQGMATLGLLLLGMLFVTRRRNR